MDGILIAYGELFLKSEPVRRIFEKKLLENIKLSLKQKKLKFKIHRKRGRIFVETDKIEEASALIKKIFGIVWITPYYHLKTSNMKKIQNFCKRNYKNWIKKTQTFAVRARRTGKHKYTSQELAKAVGDVIDRKVDLSKPDKKIFVEVRDNDFTPFPFFSFSFKN